MGRTNASPPCTYLIFPYLDKKAGRPTAFRRGGRRERAHPNFFSFFAVFSSHVSMFLPPRRAGAGPRTLLSLATNQRLGGYNARRH